MKMTTSWQRLRADWQAPRPAAALPVSVPAVLPLRTLYNEFDYHHLAYRHVDAATQDLLGVSATAFRTDAVAAWGEVLPTALQSVFTEELLPELAAALRQHAAPEIHFGLHLTYPVGTAAPYRQIEHRLRLRTDPVHGRPLHHRAWIQPSLRDTKQLAIRLHLASLRPGRATAVLLARDYFAPTVFDTQLSERERTVAHHMIQGATSADIAKRYFISVHTVSSHRRTILLKLKVKHTAALIWLAASVGWTGQAEPVAITQGA